MKLRVLIVLWIAILVVLGAILFYKPPEPQRNMVYYAGCVEKIAEGGEAPSGCIVISADDKDYLAKVNSKKTPQGQREIFASRIPNKK